MTTCRLGLSVFSAIMLSLSVAQAATADKAAAKPGR
jgi:hypothetical protein